MSDLEQRRLKEQRCQKVDELLVECAQQKLQRGASHEAKSRALRAYELAKDSPRLPSPWPELAAYRLAHLKLRFPNGAQEVEELKEIDGLLQEACKQDPASSPTLRALANIYRLAVLHRLVGHSRTTQRQRLFWEQRIPEVFDRTRDEIQRLSAQSSDGAEGRKHPTIIQQNLFNMLELASYFLNANYQPLEGLGALDPVDTLTKGWFLVGPEPVISQVRRCEEFARQELKSRGVSCADAVLFCLPPPRSFEKPEWCLARDGRWEEVGEAGEIWLRLLARVLRPAEDLSRAALSQDLLGGGISRVNLRQHIKRIRDALRKLSGRPTLKVFVEESDPLRMTGEIEIYGAVSQDGYQTRRRNLR